MLALCQNNKENPTNIFKYTIIIKILKDKTKL